MRKVRTFYEFSFLFISSDSSLLNRSNHHSQENDTTSPYCMDCTAMIQSASSDSDTTTKSSSNKNSTKIKKIIDILKETRETNPGEKTIIFSQFTSMLDLMEKSLNQEGFKFCRCKFFFFKKSNFVTCLFTCLCFVNQMMVLCQINYVREV